MYYRIYSALLLLSVFSACVTPNKTEKVDRNISYIYNPNSTYIHPDYDIYHKNDSISEILVRINTSELLFNQANPQNILASRISFHYELYELTDTLARTIADTGKYDFEIPQDEDIHFYITKMNFRCNYNKAYILRIFLFDRMRDYWLQTFLHVDKRNKKNSQNYMVLSKNGKAILFNKIITSSDTCIIHSEMNPNLSKCYICFYKKQERYSPVEAGNSTDILQNPDSCWISNLSDTSGVVFPKEGCYVIRTDTGSEAGMLIEQFGKNYPDVRNVNEMVGPLAYVTSIDEYRQITSSPKIKVEIDNFWLKCGGSTDRARELIKIYYNRVKYANVYFTADREGWKTDRGMIYVLFGPPPKLFKSDTEEKWVYQRDDKQDVPFIFQKRKNPFSNNDYVLKPGNHIESAIDDMIDLWTQGKILY